MNLIKLRNVSIIRFFFVLLLLGSFYSLPAFAECGGDVQCIGVGLTEADALQAHHGGPAAPSPSLAFGNQPADSTSAAQTIFVAAVGGSASSTAVTLDTLTITGTDASDFTISGGNCSAINGPVHGGALCTIDVTFNPISKGAKTATLNVNLNTPCAGCITGRTVNLAGVSGEADPSTNQQVIGLLASQAQTARRFSQAQMTNVQSRMESLHRDFKRSSPTRLNLDNSGAIEAVGTLKLSKNQVIPEPLKQVDQNQTKTSFAEQLIRTLSSESLALSLSNKPPSRGSSSLSIWAEGNINFGTLKAANANGNNQLRFNTDGLSIGVDRPFGEKIILGFGMGVANDRTVVGNSGSLSKADANSLFVYGSFLLSDHLFLDTMIGNGSISYDLTRHIAAVDGFALGQREADQLFASISASYELRDEALLFAPYLRLDSRIDTLDAYSETGAGANTLSYNKETINSNRYALGLRIESAHQANFGWVLPQFRVEWSKENDDDRQSIMTFANQPTGTSYTVNSAGQDNDSLMVGIGSDFIYNNGLKLSAKYQVFDNSASESDQSVGLSLHKTLDDKPFLPQFTSTMPLETPIQMVGSFTHNDNLTREGNSMIQPLSDQIYAVKLGTRKAFPVSKHTQLIVKGYLSTEQLKQYHGLDKVTFGAKAEYQYRPSSEFDATTFALFFDLAHEDYNSALRSNNNNTIGLSARQLLTDKISVFGALQHVDHSADNMVFDTSYNALRVIADYSLARSGTLYLGAQQRKGDLVSSTSNHVYYNQVQLASVADDAFPDQSLTAIRFDAKTSIWTLGYSRPLGPRDSIDLSMIKVDSKASSASNISYDTMQYSLAYIMRL
jgi:uncharacterized protein YhjY with autotransporter beta-barrel domain